MSSVITKTGAVETVVAGPIVDGTGAPLTGLTSIEAAVFRQSDKTFLDWSNHTFTATPVTEYQALTELDSVRAPGIYYLDIDTSLFVSPAANDRYFVYLSQQGASSAVNALSMGELRVGTIVDKIEANLTAAVDVAVSTRLATGGYTAPPTASTIAAAVVAQAIAGAPGGSVGAALTTASGYVVPTVANIWGYDISGNATPTQAGGALTAVRQYTTWTPSTLNKKAIDAVGQKLKIYADDGVTVLYQPALHDINGGAPAPAAGEPAVIGG